MNQPTDAPGIGTARAPVSVALVPAGIGALCLLVTLGGEPVRELARFDRAGIEAGELWRLVTGHWVHLGWAHTLLNVAALGIVAALFAGVLSRRDWVVGALLATASIDAGLYWLEPGVGWYVGLSGVLHGIVLVGGARLAAVQPKLGSAVLAGLAAKLVWETVAGPSPWAEAAAGGAVIVTAHLYGTVGASVYVGAGLVRRVCKGSL